MSSSLVTGEPLRLVVVGDSLAYIDAEGPQLPDAPHLYPNVLARRLEEVLERRVDVTVLARPGAAVREAWQLLSKDRHAQFDVLPGADAVVVGIGSFDHAPAGLPAVLGAVVPYLRPAGLRRAARRGLHRVHPVLVRATGARVRRTAWPEFERLYGLVLRQVAGLARGAAGVALGPTSHRSDHYGGQHPGHVTSRRRQALLAARHGFPTVQTWPLVLPHADDLNADGIHWPPAAHHAVGSALAEPLARQLLGRSPRPDDPWADVVAEVTAAGRRPVQGSSGPSPAS